MVDTATSWGVRAIVAVFTLVAVLMLAAVVDLGNLRQEKKQVTLATDASALAAAASIDFRKPDGDGHRRGFRGSVRSTDVVDTNVGAVAKRYWPSPRIAAVARWGARSSSPRGKAWTAYVTVTATESVDYAFSGATGQRSGAASGTSSARIAAASGGLLYPIGLCTAGAIQSLQGALTKTFVPPVSTTILFDGACGGSGNKRQVQVHRRPAR